MNDYYDDEDYEMTPLEKALQPLFEWERKLIERKKKLDCAKAGHIQTLVDSYSFPPENRKIHKFSCSCGEATRNIYADTGEEVPPSAYRRGINAWLERETHIFDLLPKEPWIYDSSEQSNVYKGDNE